MELTGWLTLNPVDNWRNPGPKRRETRKMPCTCAETIKQRTRSSSHLHCQRNQTCQIVSFWSSTRLCSQSVARVKQRLDAVDFFLRVLPVVENVSTKIGTIRHYRQYLLYVRKNSEMTEDFSWHQKIDTPTRSLWLQEVVFLRANTDRIWTI